MIEHDINSLAARVSALEEKAEKLEIECLLGRYMLGAFVEFYLEREPKESRKHVFNMIFSEARACAEIDGWAEEFDAVFEFDGDDAKGLVRKRSIAAPFFI